MYRCHGFHTDAHMCYPTEGTEFQEGQEILFNCEVRYHGYKAPTLVWRDELGNELADAYLVKIEGDPSFLRYTKIWTKHCHMMNV